MLPKEVACCRCPGQTPFHFIIGWIAEIGVKAVQKILCRPTPFLVLPNIKFVIFRFQQEARLQISDFSCKMRLRILFPIRSGHKLTCSSCAYAFTSASKLRYHHLNMINVRFPVKSSLLEVQNQKG
jgi:hypothetical protein